MAADGPGGEDEVRATLAEVVGSQPDIVEDSERLSGYLRDMCPTRGAQVAVIVVAVRAGVRDELSRVSHGLAVEALSARLAARLHTEFGIDDRLARWAVDSWAFALGVPGAPPAAAGAPPTPAAPDDALRAMAAPVTPAQPDDVPDAPATVPPPPPKVEEPTGHQSPLHAAGRTVHRPRPPVATPPAPAARSNQWRTRALVGGGALAASLAVVAVLVLARGGDTPDPVTEPTTTAAAPTVTTTRPVVAKTVAVRSDVPWNDTGVDVEAGQPVRITASGTIETAKGDPSRDSGPAGKPGEEILNNVIDGVKHGALIGMIGRGQPFEVGARYEEAARGTGRLYLGVNDKGVENNQGEYTAEITVG